MSIATERRALQSQIRHKRKEVIPKLRTLVKKLERDRKKRLRECKAECKAAQRKAKRAATVAKKKLEQHIQRARKKAGSVCKSCKLDDDKALDAFQNALSELNKERESIEQLRKKVSTMKSTRGRAGGKKAAEIRAESDDAVIFNLGENRELIGLFKSVRNKIKASPRRSRTEAFLEWVHDHPEELDAYRSKKQLEYEREAKKLFREREAPPCTEQLEQCELELAELQAAEKFLEEVEYGEEVPF
jgi:hypothetical protein